MEQPKGEIVRSFICIGLILLQNSLYLYQQLLSCSWKKGASKVKKQHLVQISSSRGTSITWMLRYQDSSSSCKALGHTHTIHTCVSLHRSSNIWYNTFTHIQYAHAFISLLTILQNFMFSHYRLDMVCLCCIVFICLYFLCFGLEHDLI